MSIELSSDRIICYKCGRSFNRRKGFFPVSYSIQNKGIGYAPVCRECIDQMYNTYLAQCNSAKLAVRQMCRKMDLYWDESVYNIVSKKSTTSSMMSQYMGKITSTKFAGKCYDDTLSKEGTLWYFAENGAEIKVGEPEEDDEPVDEEIVSFWGPGYTSSMYNELEQRRAYWMSRLPDGITLDIGTEAIIKQMCSLELDINRDRAAGRPVDKSINALNTLLGSANLKPVQKKQEEMDAALNNTPMGVWLYRYENKRPLPDTYEDSKILKYVFTWMGHLCKMLGIKDNKYTGLYEEEIRKYTVSKPEYDGDDEDAFLEELEETPMHGEE